jgi:surfactin synthase thioesterase subunit
MGATVAFEVARILQSTSPITHLVVSGRVAPHLSIQGSIRYSGISDEEIVQDLLNLSGTDRTLIGDSDAIGLIMPAVRNDYIALSKYRYAPGVKLGAPVTALVGDRDPLVSVSAASGWRKATTGRFELRLLREAGHFYPTEQLRRQVAGVIDGAAYGDQRAIEKIQRFAVDDISDGIIHPLQTTGTLVRLGGTFDDAP